MRCMITGEVRCLYQLYATRRQHRQVICITNRAAHQPMWLDCRPLSYGVSHLTKEGQDDVPQGTHTLVVEGRTVPGSSSSCVARNHSSIQRLVLAACCFIEEAAKTIVRQTLGVRQIRNHPAHNSPASTCTTHDISSSALKAFGNTGGKTYTWQTHIRCWQTHLVLKGARRRKRQSPTSKGGLGVPSHRPQSWQLSTTSRAHRASRDTLSQRSRRTRRPAAPTTTVQSEQPATNTHCAGGRWGQTNIEHNYVINA